jgi:hypothetical protein
VSCGCMTEATTTGWAAATRASRSCKHGLRSIQANLSLALNSHQQPGPKHAQGARQEHYIILPCKLICAPVEYLRNGRQVNIRRAEGCTCCAEHTVSLHDRLTDSGCILVVRARQNTLQRTSQVADKLVRSSAQPVHVLHHSRHMAHIRFQASLTKGVPPRKLHPHWSGQPQLPSSQHCETTMMSMPTTMQMQC